MRWGVSLLLPTWSTDRLRRKFGNAAPPADTPLVLIGREGKQQVALAADAAAPRAGLRPVSRRTNADSRARPHRQQRRPQRA
jgi:protein ImuB